MNRRRFLSGLTGATIGLTAMFSYADTANEEEVILQISMAPHEIAVHEAIQNSAHGIVLHHGDNFDRFTLESLKNSISRMGFKVSAHGGGPENGVASYAFGQNFPAAHYDIKTAHVLLDELQRLSDLHTLANYYQSHLD